MVLNLRAGIRAHPFRAQPPGGGFNQSSRLPG